MPSGLRDISPKEIKHALVNLAASGDLIAAVTGKSIVVVYWALSTAAATTITFLSDSTPITGDIGTLADDPVFAGYCPDGHFRTVAGEKLAITVASGSADGYITYYEE